ncbi:MAG: plasmid pRiA4b ORF-3 family protein [Bacillota bacterium]|nr:plasmid pRiA4b ORF-3 family protein [Bacillota bacterium]
MAYQTKVTIRDIEPPVWRRLKVPASVTFHELHRIIQVAFGWLDYHLYKFEFEDAVVVEENPDFSIEELYGEDLLHFEPEETPISELFDHYDSCVYEYDFGDGWEHDIVVEKRLKESKRNAVPVCLGGERHRPPEDVGGPGGYQEFLETIRDKDNPERDDMLSWGQKDTRGRLFDPEYFHLEAVNRRLLYVLEDTRESAEQLLVNGRGLTGALKIGWFEPYIQVGPEKYTWERIGDLLTWLDEGVTVTIKVTPPDARRRPRRQK